jgi:hypothetical protein
MATYEINGKTIYIDGKLQDKLDKIIIPELKQQDRDVVFVVSGRERDGKSTLAISIAGYIASKLKTEFTTDNIHFTPNDLRDKLEVAKRHTVHIYDEAHRGMGSMRALSEVNRILRDLFTEMGFKNLCVFIVLPYFFMLDKYMALVRSRGLFHVYLKSGRRGFFVYYNETQKLKLYFKGKRSYDMNCMKYPHFRGRFTKKVCIDEQKYRNLKTKAFETREISTKEEKYQNSHYVGVKIMYKHCNMTQPQIKDVFKEEGIEISQQQISYILRKLGVEMRKKEKPH